jgi:threonine/homoserine/homoserine lactone efflux protein
MIPVWGFVAVTVPLVLIPGASTTLVLRNSISGGTRAGIVTAIGINGGSFFYGLLTAFGFAVALTRWPSAWSVIRACGVAYLAWLGLKSLRHAFSTAPPVIAASGGQASKPWRNLREGFVTNTLNPAIATFYLIVLPQFIPRGAPIVASALLLTAIHIGIAATWHLTWAAAGGTLAHVFAGGTARRVLEGVAGGALLILAGKVALG